MKASHIVKGESLGFFGLTWVRKGVYISYTCVAAYSTNLQMKSAQPKFHLDIINNDIIETMFLNMFFNGQLKAMPPK